MIKAYLVGISNYIEGEDIEVRYHIYNDQELICKKSVFLAYKKPAIVNLAAVIIILKELEKNIGDEIFINVNDSALNEQIRGTTKTKNIDVLKMANTAREELNKFGNSLTIVDISPNWVELAKWNEELKL